MILKCAALLILLSITTHQSPGQKTMVDSLKQELKEHSNDSSRVILLNQIALILVNIDPDESNDYLKEAMDLGTGLNYKKGMATTYSIYGILYFQAGNYDESITNHFQALKIREQINDVHGVSNTHNNIGNVYRDMQKNDEAIQMYLKALEGSKKLNNQQGIANALNNLGNAYTQKEQYDLAIDYFLRSADILNAISDEQGLAGAVGNIGAIYYFKKDFQKALEYFMKSLEVRTKFGDNYGIVSAKINIAQANLDLGNTEVAHDIFISALELAKLLESKERIKLCLLGLADTQYKMKNYKEAFDYDRQYSLLKDTLINEEVSKRIAEMQSKYETQKKDQEIKLLTKDRMLQMSQAEKQKTVKNGILLGSIGLFSIFGLMFINFKGKKQREKIEINRQLINTEMKSLRSQMNPHFIFNSLQSIQNFLINNKSEDANEYLLKFSKLMRLVLENSQVQEVSLKDDVMALELYMQLEQLRFSMPFDYEISFENTINQDTDTIPPLLLQPFVENAIWHGLQYKSEPGKISIQFRKHGENLICVVEDNGVGRANRQKFKSTIIKKESLGMKLTEERISLLHKVHGVEARLSVLDLFSPDNKPTGTRVEVWLPMAG